MSDSDRQCMEQIVREGDIGYLALTSDEPYVIPINYAYCDGRLLFHCALEGRKLDLIRANPTVCMAVARQEGHPAPHAGDACDNPFESVLCWGEARVIDDLDERQRILNEFQARYDTPEHQREPISLDRAEKCGAVEITVTRMTGRKVSGKEKLRWEWEAE
jgi:nitroimidazol reductase NimA-like FMN-containing flavoprotein (pyridoxamine 5'-phosphate oxidase superfamily)